MVIVRDGEIQNMMGINVDFSEMVQMEGSVLRRFHKW